MIITAIFAIVALTVDLASVAIAFIFAVSVLSKITWFAWPLKYMPLVGQTQPLELLYLACCYGVFRYFR